MLQHTSQITVFALSVCLFEGCVLVVSVIEQLAQWHNSTVKAAVERLCNYIPGKYQIRHHMLCWYRCISLLIKNSHVESAKALPASRAASQMNVAEGAICREVSGAAHLASELGFRPKVRMNGVVLSPRVCEHQHMQTPSLRFSPLCLFVSSLRIDSLYAQPLLFLVDMGLYSNCDDENVFSSYGKPLL